jgi:hypothetical protein
MYHLIVRHKIRQAFADINAGCYDNILQAFARKRLHVFYGDHALAGVRETPDDTARWYERLAIIFPDLNFEISNLSVTGWPWRTTVMVEWIDRFAIGNKPMSNNGVHRMTMKWGKVSELAIYCDTQKLATALNAKADLGLSEASAAIIGKSLK